MTQAQLDDAVAGATGESIRTIRHHGFSLVPPGRGDATDEDVGLVVTCPRCRRPVPYAGLTRGGAAVMAECLDCDILFDVAPDQIRATGPVDAPLP